MDDFSMLLPMGILDESGLFLEEPIQSEWPEAGHGSNGTLRGTTTDESGGATPASSTSKNDDFDDDLDSEDDEDSAEEGGGGKRKRGGPKKKGSGSLSRGAKGSAASVDGGPEESEAEKVRKRRQQIAAASRASRARRKRELEDLRDENKRLREERSQFLSKIGELQMKVEHMRERGSTDMRVENELLRAQLEEHKRFVSCFKRLCEGAPTSLNARHMIYKQGSDSAHAHVLGLISQSQADDWQEAIVPPEADIPYQNFSMFYKFKNEYGEFGPGSDAAAAAAAAPGAAGTAAGGAAPAAAAKTPRQRLNVRVDVLFPGMDAVQIAEFFWNSFSNTSMQSRLYKVKGIELTQLADDMPDKDTKTVYYREKWEAPKKDQDWVIICNRRRRELASSTLALPQKGNRVKPEVGKVAAMVLALATTTHSVAPQFENANRITSLFVQGAVTWNVGSDARLCCVFSLPDDLSIKAVERFEDVIDAKGRLTTKFAAVLRSFREMMGETTGHDLM